MLRRIFLLIIPGLILFLLMVSIGACQRANTPEAPTKTTTYSPTQSEEDIASTEITSQTTQKPINPIFTQETENPYPAPGGSSDFTPIATQPNPRTQITTTPPPYPGPATSTTGAVRTPTMSSTANEPDNGTQISYPTPELSPGTPEEI